MKSRFHQSLMLLVSLVIPLACHAVEKSLADMEREAKQVLSDPDNLEVIIDWD